jgi:SSS family solute:Na+ symporter
LTLDKLTLFGWNPFAGSQLEIYVGAVAIVANLLVAVVATLILRVLRVSNGTDETVGTDYHADVAPPKKRKQARETEPAPAG